MKRKKWIILFCLFFLLNSTLAQFTDLKFEHLTVEDGLSQNSVFCVLQDSYGFLWFGTQDGGVNKFDGYDFTIYTNMLDQPGSIAGNNISKLYEDKKGRVWIGTWGAGLDLYDPSFESFTHYKHHPETTNCISHNRIRAIIEDLHGNMWIGTAGGGLNKLVLDTETFKHYQSDQQNSNSLLNDIIWDLDFDQRNLLWIATDKGISIFDPVNEKFILLDTLINNRNPLSGKQIRCITIGGDGFVWVGTTDGLYGINLPQKSIYQFSLNDDLSNDPGVFQINTVFEDHDGQIWIGSHAGGLFLFNKKSETFLRFTHDPKNPYSISFNDIREVFQDISGNLWIATRGGGVNRLNVNATKFNHYSHNPFNSKSLSSNQVWAICEDFSGGIWVGTYGGGLNLLSRESGNFKHYLAHPEHVNSLSNNIVLSLYPGGGGVLWIGTQGGGLNKFIPETGEFTIYSTDESNDSGIGDNLVSCLLEDSNGILWIGTDMGLDKMDIAQESFVHYRSKQNDSTSISDNRIWSIYLDSEERLWIGTDNGLNLFDQKANEFQRFLYHPDDVSSISDNDIFCIYQDALGNMWFGTGRGLSRLVSLSGGFDRFTSLPHLSGIPVYGIVEDMQKNLWISTINGLVQFNRESMDTRYFDASDGLQSNEFIRGAYWQNPITGEICLGGINGFNTFLPEEIAVNTFIPPVVITQFNLFNQPVTISDKGPLFQCITETKEIKLNYRQYDFSFRFVALNYTNTLKNQYKYRLSGYEEEWKEVGADRTATYTNISHGSYIFSVIGSNNDDIWNEEGASIRITITPPFWKTTIFYTGTALFILLSIIGAIKIRERNLLREKKILEVRVAERTQEVMDQKSEIERKNLEITDSITYAQRIQNAILPEKQELISAFPESFVLYQPKDIVSGDFYWFGKHLDNQIVAVVDCTGHGVPGAFMSMIGNSLLNHIVFENQITRPDEILAHLDRGIIHALKQEGQGLSYQDDGMDASVCCINDNSEELLFAGASQSIILVNNNSFRKLEGDIYSIGGVFSIGENDQFALHKLTITPGEMLYLYSDGYQDQFGGNNNQKFMATAFEELIREIFNKSMVEQQKILETRFESWRGENKQTDDVLVMGLRLSC